MIFMNSLAKRLRFARQECNLTQVQLSRLSGVQQSDISKLELGVSLKTANLVQLAKALKVNPLWLDIGDGEMLDFMQRSNAFDEWSEEQPLVEMRPHPSSSLIRSPNISSNSSSAVQIQATLQALTTDLLALDDSTRRAVSVLLAQYAADPIGNSALLPAINLLLAPAKELPQAKQA